MNDAIPFFDSLPVKAIPAVQRLFDEAQSPGYSLPAVYSNLVSRLNSCGVIPPARALVKRWLAGVAIGKVERPKMPGAPAEADEPPVTAAGYFESLPEAALPALAVVWDAIQAASGSDTEADEEEKAFDAFFDAMRAIGHREPEWKPFVAYAYAVRAGQVERPARQIVEEVPSTLPADDVTNSPLAEEPAPKRRGRRAKADVMVADPANGEISQPDIVIEADAETGTIVRADVVFGEGEEAPAAPSNAPEVPALAAVKSAAIRLRDEIVAQLSANIEQTAREATARMLREVADEVEHADG
ncbi:hypothetical protein [Shinella sp.]|uniref:hypothetical protein n=1 Tax=Shinella sp. TaxID=1870904 RepID=UPI0039E41690